MGVIKHNGEKISRESLLNMSATQAVTRISRSVALDKDVAKRAAKAAKAQNRSFSNYVETLIANALSESQTTAKAAR